jgi:hypothetical protein
VKDPFDVWRFDFPGKGEHPVVLISHPNRCARGALVNVLYCTRQRQSRQPYPYEVLLNGADAAGCGDPTGPADRGRGVGDGGLNRRRMDRIIGRVCGRSGAGGRGGARPREGSRGRPGC